MQWRDLGRDDPRQTIPGHTECDFVYHEHSQRKVTGCLAWDRNADSEEDQTDREYH